MVSGFRANGLLLAGLALVVSSPLGIWMESSMVTHVLLEIPVLVLIGWALGAQFRKPLHRALCAINAGGISGLLLASLTLAFWMIPLWLDASLSDPWVAGFKYVSLVFLAGIPLALSWPMAHSITRALVKIEFLTMLFRLAACRT